VSAISPQYSRSQVNRAGEVLRRSDSPSSARLEAAETLANWRASHNYPINTFQATLRSKLKAVDEDAIVAQRLKRIPSIVAKLERYPNMQLARMEDIGGLRAIVSNLDGVRQLHEDYRHAHFKHVLFKEHDYVREPKETGYRSIHLVYQYRNDLNEDARKYSGLLLEVQLRTRIQHAWAAAVETMGTILNCQLKSGEGPPEWLGFFAATGSAFAHLEGQPPVPAYEGLSALETYRLVARLAQQLMVRPKLSGYSVAIRNTQVHDRRTYYLLSLDPVARVVRTWAYGRNSFELATSDYLKAEEAILKGSQQQAVLVATKSIQALRWAYPSFFLDTKEFLKLLAEVEHLAIDGS
jgi:putative GTP pyrophosphokinase